MAKKPDKFAMHEAMDRAYMLGEMVEEFLCDHMAILSNPEWKNLASTAEIALRELYNSVAKVAFK